MGPQRVSFALLGIALAFLGGCAGAQYRPARAQAQPRRGFIEALNLSTKPPRRAIEISEADEDQMTDDDHRVLEIQRSPIKLRWPLERAVVTSKFGGRRGERGGDFHEGVDLRADRGTPVLAAEAGRVVYAGRGIQGYGKLVVLKHSDQLATVYAHNSEFLVRKGMTVSKGQRVALSGNTGHTTGPHLHFEVRHGPEAVDPERVVGVAAPVQPLSRRMASK